jgi:hypothetical protein
VNAVYVKEDPLIRLQDLTPQKDPKGGSPKTPSGGIRVPRQQTPYPPYMTTDIEPKKIGFFHLQFRDVLYTISLIAVGLLFIFQRQSEVKELANSVGNIKEAVSQLTLTAASQQKLIDANTSEIRIQSERNLEQDKRIGEAQSQLITLIPMVIEIKTKLNFIADLMDSKSKQKP